jgi:sugar phosphate isomerase/epimerase
MPHWRIGLSTGCFYNQNIIDCLPLIRESGFSTIEVCSSPTHLDFHNEAAVNRAAARISELGMEAYSLHAPFAPNIDISSSDAAQREASLVEICKAANAAALLHAHYFVLHPGPENHGPAPAEEQLSNMQHVIDSINRIARRCRELGVICVLENKLPHLLFGNTSDILWILDGINGAEVGVCLDTGHAFLSGDVHNLTHKLAGHLRMVHAHDNGGIRDDHLPPGDGKIDWTQLLQDLVAVHFHGPFILEMAGGADPNATMANARRGRSYLRRLARRLALQNK